MPLNLANPVWVDADPDVDEHVVEPHLHGSRGAGQAAQLQRIGAEDAELHGEGDGRDRKSVV